MRSILTVIILLVLLAAGPPGQRESARVDTPMEAGVPGLRGVPWDSVIRMLTSPAMEERKVVRRTLQRNGYVAVLREALRGDAPGALLAYLRLRGHIDLGISHRLLYVYVPVPQPEPGTSDRTFVWSSPPASPPVAVPLYDDWTFPADPWDTTSTSHAR